MTTEWIREQNKNLLIKLPPLRLTFWLMTVQVAITIWLLVGKLIHKLTCNQITLVTHKCATKLFKTWVILKNLNWRTKWDAGNQTCSWVCMSTWFPSSSLISRAFLCDTLHVWVIYYSQTSLLRQPKQTSLWCESIPCDTLRKVLMLFYVDNSTS